jgi:hypothetical protein
VKRFALVPVIAVLLVLLAGATAVAAGTAVNRDTSGPFVGTSVFNGRPACSFFHQTFDATYTTDQAKAGTVHVDGCVGGAGPTFTYSGTFVLTAPNRATLGGAVSGVISSASTGCTSSFFAASLNFTLSPANGTKQLQHAEGTIRFNGTWCSPAVPGEVGPIFGTLTANLS